MNSDNIYFENIPSVGSLYLEKVFCEFESEPSVFVCKDNYSSRYLALMNIGVDVLRYYIIKINVEDIIKLIQKDISLYTAFIKKEQTKFIYTIENDDTISIKSIVMFCEDQLPPSTTMLRPSYKLDDYIDYLNNLIYIETTQQLKYTISFEVSSDKMLDCRLYDNDEFSTTSSTSIRYKQMSKVYEKESLNLDSDINIFNAA